MFPNLLSTWQIPVLDMGNVMGWMEVIWDSFNLFTNMDWTKTFWKPTNTTTTMHIFGINKNVDAKRIAVFWAIGIIKYAHLWLNTLYSSWNIKVVCNKKVVDGFRKILWTWNILGKTWIKLTDNYLNIFIIKAYVKDLTAFMNNNKGRK